MSIDHKRPLLAFVLLTLVCAISMGYSLRVDGLAGFLDRGPVLSTVVAAGVTLEALAEDTALPAGDGDATAAEETTSLTLPRRGHSAAVPAVTGRAADGRRAKSGADARFARHDEVRAGERSGDRTVEVLARSAVVAERPERGKGRGHLPGRAGQGEQAGARDGARAKHRTDRTRAGHPKRHGKVRARSARGRR